MKQSEKEIKEIADKIIKEYFGPLDPVTGLLVASRLAKHTGDMLYAVTTEATKQFSESRDNIDRMYR